MNVPYIEKTSADPAAGAEITFTADEDLILVALSLQLVTDATVANRRVTIIVDDGVDIYYQCIAPADQAASLTNRYSAGGGVAAVASGTVQTLTLPERIFVPKNGRVRTSTTALQAGDNFGPMTLAAERE